jgi:hypothetical protein
VLGDLDGLVPSPARTAPYVPADEADVARVSVETIARFADLTRRLVDARDGEVDGLDDESTEDPVDQGRRRRGVFRR